jgi:hypothetical protein
MNEVSKNPLRRSTIPLDSGSRGRSSTNRVASVPANAVTPSASRRPRPIPDSLSQISRRGTRPSWRISSHDPSSRSSVLRVGIIRAVMNRECAAVTTSTGSSAVLPSSSGIRAGRNHRSHCAASPGSHVSRSAGSRRCTSGRSSRTLSRNQVIDPSQPTRSASTVAGISGQFLSSSRTRGSNGENDDGAGFRSYFGGTSDATARATVDRPTPRSRATCRCGTRPPPAAGSTPNPPLRSPIQSAWVASFSSVAMASFSSVADTYQAPSSHTQRRRGCA